MIQKNSYFGNLEISKAELPEFINGQGPFSSFWSLDIWPVGEFYTPKGYKNFGCANMQYTLIIEMLITDLIDG